MRVKDKVAIVTGATSGMGRGAAVGLAREGAKIVAVGRNTNRLAEVEREIETVGGECLPVVAELSDLTAIDGIFQKTIHKFGRLNVLVCAAGSFDLGDFFENTEDFFDHCMAVNLKAGFFLAQKAATEMKENGGGKIIFFSSIAGAAIGFSTAVAYCAAKGAISGMTKALAVELAPFNIQVNAIVPGWVQTNMNKHLWVDEEYKRSQEQIVPVGYLGEPKHITPLVIYLASSESDYATGAEFTIDGGMSIN